MKKGTQPDPTGHPDSDYLHPDKLEFDPENPRFGGLLSGKTQEELQTQIFGEPYYASELVDSLVENGFIDYEPLVVRRKGDSFIVIEGNRRLAAVRHIRANLGQYPDRKSDLDSIPVLIFPDARDAQEESAMRIYLGIRHLLGFREWPPVSKAVFLDRQTKNAGGLDQIIKEVRITKQQARRFLIPYRLMRDADLTLPPGDDFWVLAEALQRAGVKAFIQLDVDANTLEVISFNKRNLLQLLDDLYGPRIKATRRRDPSSRKVKDTRDLSLFAKVISTDKARSHLHAGKSLEESAIYVDTREQSLKRLRTITKEMSLLVRKLSARGSKEDETLSLQEAFKRLDGAVKAFLKKHA
ncbi:MAG: ParB N-terminal domain-containing protein [Candidatus Acidiferrales bacterium]